MQSGRARTASYAHGRSASVACGLGQLEVALRPRSPSSQSGASRIEWKFDFSSREWMHCLVECKQLGSAGSTRCNAFSGRQQTRARERVLNRTLHSNTPRYTGRGVHVFYSGSGPKSTLLATKPKRVGPPRLGWFHCGGPPRLRGSALSLVRPARRRRRDGRCVRACVCCVPSLPDRPGYLVNRAKTCFVPHMYMVPDNSVHIHPIDPQATTLSLSHFNAEA